MSTTAARIELIEHDDPDTIQRYIWERYFRDGHAYMRVAQSRTLGEVYGDLAERVYALDNDDECVEWVAFHAASISNRDEAAAQPFPGHGREPGDLMVVACYAETGGSEGHVVRVELILFHTDIAKARIGIREVMPFACIKTFGGMDHATALARRCTDWFEQ